ncbi:MAG: hypothetical protein A2140_00160 [Candidatus Muproteobacteria bacterium RBG_16_62_13]|uniref:Uncharacterized protein n=1 Tax=Candidatus Muproteobacteria bacterium RBG_16_62_13 TaxID=1817756 RepID=A0A1F6T8Y4_9PROT|nr:MAG: hypothetical protein A2140_00160 [Candidatus Muproteobacteria bacterium RBG_16_62_13]
MDGKNLLAALLLAAVVTGGCRDKPAGEETRIKPRMDFGPEEFGIGKTHTPNQTCNRQIDALLDDVRSCYNTRGDAGCQSLQQNRNRRIAQIKNSARCRR